MYYSWRGVGLICRLLSICLRSLLTQPVNPGSFNSGGCRIAPRQEDGRIYLTYFLAKLWLRHCDIRRLTPLTFNSNSLCLVAELEHRAERHLNKSELRSNPVC